MKEKTPNIPLILSRGEKHDKSRKRRTGQRRDAMTFHCLFEQSGTFKNEFKKLGYDAIDYDILNTYGETDVQIDLFAEINKAYDGQASIFDTFTKEDTLLAFFPCVRFEAVIPLAFRGEQLQQRNWTLEQKLEYSMKLHTELHDLYMLISKMCLVCLRGGGCV